MKNNYYIFIFLLLIIAALCVKIFYRPNNLGQAEFLEARIANNNIILKILDESDEMTRGLSETEALAPDAGAFFIFEEEGFHGIWMKDMNYALDIAWLDQNKKIIHIEKEVLPETYPKVFLPPTKDKYVLEVNAGYFDQNKINIGDRLEILKILQK